MSSSSHAPTLVWFRDDLRIDDNPALTWASQRGPVVALFVDEDCSDYVSAEVRARPIGAAARWWLGRSLAELSDRLAELGVPFIRAAGDAREVVPAVAETIGASAVTWNRRYHLPFRDADAAIKLSLVEAGREAVSHPGYLLNEPWRVTSADGGAVPGVHSVLEDRAKHLARAAAIPSAGTRADGRGARRCRSPRRLRPLWLVRRGRRTVLGDHNQPCERGAQGLLAQFLAKLAKGPSYTENNDFPAVEATSQLSAHLRFGEISPARVWHEVLAAMDTHGASSRDGSAFLRQLIWRDFAWHRLFHVPDLATRNVRRQFDAFDWEWTDDADPAKSPMAFAQPSDGAEYLADLALWQSGRTGIPLVDAGMRELWATGRMHNRVRMVAGSWLTKNLGIHWRHGEEWFWDTLVDADYASNPFNWQWVAGCGDDAAPYFRIFNPLLQQEKFDPADSYVRRWVPEVGTADYPEPMVDVKESRKAALAAYGDIRSE